jgi:hypothetical protein
MRMHESKGVLSFKFSCLYLEIVLFVCARAANRKNKAISAKYTHIFVVRTLAFSVHIRQNTVMNVLSNRGQEWYAAES